MGVQQDFYSTDGQNKTFPSTKHIATKQHMAVWLRQKLDTVEVQLDPSKYELITNAAVLNSSPSTILYDRIEIRVADSLDELTSSPSAISVVAGIAEEVVTVAGIESEVVTVADDTVALNLVADDLAKGIGTNQPTDSAILNALTNATQTQADVVLAAASANEAAASAASVNNPAQTITELLSFDTSVGYVNVLGYHTANDGGGGIFNYDSTIDKSTANSGTIIDPSVSLALQGTGVGFGCWVRQYSGAVNAAWFGVVNGGIVNNSTSLQNANTLNMPLYFNDGVYYSTYFPAVRCYGNDATITNGSTSYKLSNYPNKLGALVDIITVGTNALGADVGGASSVIIGNGAGAKLAYSNSNVLIGDLAGSELIRDVSLPFEAVHNVMVGRYAGLNTTSGYYATFVGSSAGIENTTGKANTFIGQNAGRNNTIGSDNTFVGEGAGANSETGNSNTGIGVNCGLYSTGAVFTAIGGASLFMPFSGDNNTAVGGGCIYGADDGIGDGGSNIARTYLANNNSAVGREAMYFTDNGTSNSTVGRRSLYSIEDGNYNCGLGAEAAYNFKGSSSTFIGYRAGYETSTGILETFIGHNAGYYVNGSNNTLIGYTAGKGSTGASDFSNSVAVGHEAGLSLQTASSGATAIGRRALFANTTGANNTALGQLAGSSNVSFSNITALGYNAQVTASNQIQLGNSSTTTYAYGAVQDRSDRRDKADIVDISDAMIAFFMDIEWKSFVMDYREDYIIKNEDGEIIEELPKDGSLKRTRSHMGAIAQQVEEAMIKHGIDFAGLQHHSVNDGEDVYSLGYQQFIAIQGKIIQKQQADIDAIKKHIGI